MSGPLTFTTTGSAQGRGFGVVIGDIRTNGSLQNGHTIQFDPGYDCGTTSAGSRIGSLVIQRWIAVPLAGSAARVHRRPGRPLPGIEQRPTHDGGQSSTATPGTGRSR